VIWPYFGAPKTDRRTAIGFFQVFFGGPWHVPWHAIQARTGGTRQRCTLRHVSLSLHGRARSVWPGQTWCRGRGRHLFHWCVTCLDVTSSTGGASPEGVQARVSLQFPPASGRGRWATAASGCSHGCAVYASDAVGVTQGAPLTGSQSELSCAGASVFALSVALQATGPTPEVCSVGLLEAVAPGGPVRLDRVRVVCLLALRGGPRCALSRSTAGRESHFRAAGVLECRLASGPASIGPEAYASTLFESLRVD
jgi:hypothetical protein